MYLDNVTVYLRRETSLYVDRSIKSFGRVERTDVVVYQNKNLTKLIRRFLWDDPIKPTKTKKTMLIDHDIFDLIWLPDFKIPMKVEEGPIPFPFPFKSSLSLHP